MSTQSAVAGLFPVLFYLQCYTESSYLGSACVKINVVC